MQTYGEIGKTEAEAEKAMLQKSDEVAGTALKKAVEITAVEMAQDAAQQEVAKEMADTLSQAAEAGYTAVEEGAVSGYKTIEKNVVGGYKAIENTVVGGYKAIESTVVGSYEKIENAFVSAFLTKDGETTEQAKQRLKAEQAERTAKGKK